MKFKLEDKKEVALQKLKKMFCNTPIISLTNGTEDFVVYRDTSNQGLGCVMMQKRKLIAYES